MPIPSRTGTTGSRIWKSIAILFAAGFAFDLLFWDQDIGINLPIYAVLIAGLLLLLYGWRGTSKPAKAVMGGLLIACAMVVIHNSVVSIILAFVSLFVFAALAHEPALRSLFYGVAAVLSNFAMTPVAAFRNFGTAMERGSTSRQGWGLFRLAIIPVVLVVIYFQIYRVANPKFDHLTAGSLDTIATWIGDLIANVFTPHSVFFLFALFLSAGLLFRSAPNWLAPLEQQWTDKLLRARSKRPHWLVPLGMNALDRERKMGLLFLVMMNLLLLVVNAVDISWIWWGFEVPKDFSLKQFVHEGTWLLIISILLSMVIMLRLFRGNQNFHPKNELLRALAFAWVAQNFILGMSVFIRNYHYIHFHGLAYKRIGVVVFLGLVMMGLVTLYLKIRHRHSLFHLLRVNGWAAFVVLVGLTLVNWDGVITRYNLGHWNQGEVDVDNYLAMSDKVLPILYADLATVEKQMQKHATNEVVWIRRGTMGEFKPELEYRRQHFLDRWAGTGWQGWNLADARTFRTLDKMGLVGR